MATLHKEYIKFNKTIKLTSARKEKLKKSRKAIKKKIRKWFKENKPKELQPKFWGQGSFDHNTIINPIPEKDESGNKLLKYDLDYGTYFIEHEDEDNKKAIETWHNWVYTSVEDHTDTPPKKKTTCIRVIFSDGHHIDLPIYYRKNEETPELAHKSKGWLESDPKAFTDWVIKKKTDQTIKIVRYLKGWKNYREHKNTHLKLPSGFELTILVFNNYKANDNDDIAFRNTIKAIKEKLDKKFECFRSTTPTDEDLFKSYSKTRKENFLNNLANLIKATERAKDEKNFKKASEYLRKHFGDRFPLGEDKNEDKKSNELKASILRSGIQHKPYGKKY